MPVFWAYVYTFCDTQDPQRSPGGSYDNLPSSRILHQEEYNASGEDFFFHCLRST